LETREAYPNSEHKGHLPPDHLDGLVGFFASTIRSLNLNPFPPLLLPKLSNLRNKPRSYIALCFPLYPQMFIISRSVFKVVLPREPNVTARTNPFVVIFVNIRGITSLTVCSRNNHSLPRNFQKNLW